MSSIYYPYFQIENYNIKRHRKKYNHKLYINVLALFCTDMLIPARCLLTMGQDKFDMLMHGGSLFTDKIIYFRLPNNIQNLTEYYESISSELAGINQNNINKRIERISNCVSMTEIEKYVPLEQQSYYLSKIKEFATYFLGDHNNVKGSEILQKDIESITNKEDFDKLLRKLKSDRTITNDTYVKFMEASGMLYFLAGASQKNLKVCSDPYFKTASIKTEMEMIINNFSEIINEAYMPDNILDALKELDIIEENDDINKLTYEDIKKLRSTTYFKKFANNYCKWSNGNKALGHVKSKKTKLKYMKIARDFIIGLFFAIITTAISHIFNQSFLIDLKWGVAFLIISTLLIHYFDKFVYKIKWLDNLLDKIIEFIDSDCLYLYKIKQIIQTRN